MVEATVVLAKCPKAKKKNNTFGMRIEKQKGDWVRTWAFKIDEKKAKAEGFDKQSITGAFYPADDYPGCPYCGAKVISLCSCGKVFCTVVKKDTKTGAYHSICPWCNTEIDLYDCDSVDLQGGGY